MTVFVRAWRAALFATLLGAVIPAARADTVTAPLELALAPTLSATVATELDAAPALPIDTVVTVPAPLTLPAPIDLTASTDDLFERIRRGFAMPNLDDELVTRHQTWYLSRPENLRRMVERSRRYLHYIVEEIDKRGLPTELALLPMVESAYNPLAYSRSHASGLWQFIPGTGRTYKLEQSWWVDERRDVISATGAALDYLSTIYQMHGDWQLALASYNWGEGAVGRAIEKNRARGLPTDYLSLRMPDETRNYVPKLQALKNIFATPSLVAALDLPVLPNRPYFDTVEKPADIDVKLAAKLAEIPVEEFMALNPAHTRPVIKADLPIVLPADRIDVFLSNLEQHDAPLSSWSSHTLSRGEKLEQVAKRHGISLATLKAANGLTARRPKIGPGMTLLIPRRGNDAPTASAPLSTASRVASTTPAATQSVVVRAGDTLFALAQRYDTSVDTLERLNNVRAKDLRPGMRLTLATAAPSKLAAAPRTERKRPATQRYTVRRGDTLHEIARRFNVDIDDLVRDNAVRPNHLRPGQTLTLQLAQNDR